MLRTVLICLSTLASLVHGEPVAAEENARYFNSYIHRAYQNLLNDPQRAGQGYNKRKWFTKDIDYGRLTGAIKAAEPPFTMCNAAVTETLLEAINLYAAEHPAWSPERVIPADSWNKFEWSSLKPHLFAHDYFGYPPLENNVNPSDLPIGLRDDIRAFHSEQGMPKALAKFGLGEVIRFEDAKPGDVITFDREFVNINGEERPSGHSVVFIAFLNREQDEVQSYAGGQVVGFKYFSSQGRADAGGLGERWAYFKGEMCPFAEGYSLPPDPRNGGCAEAVSSDQNRARFSPQKDGRPRDCCVVRRGSDGIRVGRVLAPERWTYEASQADVASQSREIAERVREFLRNRDSARLRLELVAKGAIALESSRPRMVQDYFRQVQEMSGLDLRPIGQGSAGVTLERRSLQAIARITPKEVIRAANQTVTLAVKEDIQRRLAGVVEVAAERLNAAQVQGVPNPRLDGSSTD